MKQTLFVLIFLLPFHADATEFSTIKGRGFGCRSLQDFETAVSFAKQGNQPAFLKFLLAKINSHACVTLKPAMRVMLEKHGELGRTCVRPDGQIDCYWTNSNILPK
ncbi:hypothetical protein ACWTU6_18425 [Mesorhizobium sp. BHbsci]